MLKRRRVGGKGRASGVPQAGALPPRAATLGVLALFFAAPAAAFTVRGNVVNGTTGKPVANAKVVVVNPSGGMLEEREVEARNGRFEITDLDPQAPIYLLRVDYDGVPYNVPIRVDGTDHEVTVDVYESTTSWEGMRVNAPHLAASRQGDHLSIEQLFEVSNESSPPRTATGDEGYFKLFIPVDMESLTTCFVTSLGVPVDRVPIPTDEPGVYRVEYPIRPGLTRIGVAYKVPYTEGRYTLNAKVLYDLEHAFVFGVDPEMKITSTSHDLQPTEPVHGMTAFSIHGVPKGVLTIAFEGGTSQMAGAGQEVGVISNDAHRVALYAMVPRLLVLLTAVGMTQRSADPLSDPKVLRAHYDLLVKRLARLDDLRAAEAVSADAHRAARDELAARLGALALKLRSLDETAAATPPPPSHVPEGSPAAAARGSTTS